MSKDQAAFIVLAAIGVWLLPAFFANRILDEHPAGRVVMAVTGVALTLAWIAVDIWAITTTP